MSVQPSEFVEKLMQTLPAVRDHVVVLEQHAIESARVAGRLHKQNKEACESIYSYFLYYLTLFFYFDILKKVQRRFCVLVVLRSSLCSPCAPNSMALDFSSSNFATMHSSTFQSYEQKKKRICQIRDLPPIVSRSTWHFLRKCSTTILTCVDASACTE